MNEFPESKRHPILPVLLWIAVACWAAGILLLSSLTPKELPSVAFVFSDKINHFLAFVVGGWLTASAMQATRPSTVFSTRLLWAIAALFMVAAFGAFDELFQLLTPGRSGADAYDWVADLIGAAAGSSLSLLTYARLERIFPRR